MSSPILSTARAAPADGTLLAVALGVGLLLRLGALALVGDVTHGATLWEYGEQAVCAFHTHGDLCGFYDGGLATYPSAYMPPLLSYFWLLLFHLFGDGAVARAAWLTASLAVALVNIWLVFRLSLSLGRSGMEAFFAAGLLAVYPTFVFVTATYHQTNWAVFFLLVIVATAVRIAQSERMSWRDAALSGLFCGLATLNRSEMLLVGPALVALSALWRRKFTDLIRIGLVAGCAMALVLAPWVTRNYILFGEVIPAAQSGGYNLWKGFNPYTNGSGNMTEEPPTGPGAQARGRIQASVAHGPLYETRLQAAFMQAFEADVDAASGRRLAQLALDKVALLWVFDWTDVRITGSLAYRLPWLIANLLVVLGLVVLWRDRRHVDKPTAVICSGALASLTVVYAASAVHARYRMHLEPILFIAAGVGAQALLSQLARRFRPL
ncbi:MAG: glycosyltransferase family 39 protein [Phenylobacterium sp.]|uniref:glycosyltransferase family 39 protein n=1 Tax=Phenylobacterium sp. TaxID=1871053 RepID=UPI0027349F45|nr:glycosyltransferase family 39 protein [Phenylobacterium sp.]MDP3175696.1 glycosyltransferase family 39 protein [Phenylobacterium sp.]